MIIRLVDLILEESDVAKQAKSQGLTSMGFGNWGKDGVVTHRTDNGKLVPVKATANNTQRKPDTKEPEERLGSRTGQYLGWDKRVAPVKGETDGGSVTYEEFTSQLPEFTETEEEIAQRDAETGLTSTFRLEDADELNDMINGWKHGGEDGIGVWSYDEQERQRVFDRLDRHIQESGITVEAPVLHRGIAFDSQESANKFLSQIEVGGTIELPPCGWAPNPQVALGYGPDAVSSPDVSVIVELQAGDTPIRGIATTRWEEEMGMDTQHEVITPSSAYTVTEVIRYTVTRDGKPHTVYKVVMKQNSGKNEAVTKKEKKYALLAYMSGNMAMASNIKHRITKNK